MINFFKQYPEFVDLDVRKVRPHGPVSAESLDNRHAVMLPDEIVKDATILDLGSCLAATGHWVLSKNALHYTGVELQAEQVDISQHLMSKYWTNDKFEVYCQSIQEFLDNAISKNKKYDVVVMIGIMYAFMDHYTLLKKVSQVCKKYIILDSIYPASMLDGKIEPDAKIIEIQVTQHINHHEERTVYRGMSGRPSPKAVELMLGTLGFKNKEDFLFPKPLSDHTINDSYSNILRVGTLDVTLESIDSATLDWYKNTIIKLPMRYLMRFEKDVIEFKTLEDVLIEKNQDHVIKSLHGVKVESKDAEPIPSWVFDKNVADRFQEEARDHIPDYERVVNLCLAYTKLAFKDKKDISVIDVGSALGFTMKKFIDAGYNNVYGVDNSQAMKDSSLYPDLTEISNTFPKKLCDVVLANWTLHFVEQRKQYIQDIFNYMKDDGLLILSDKMSHVQELEEMYYDFKRNNSVSEEIIQTKKRALLGILVTKPLQWYLDTLKEIGFENIEVVNSNMMFHTIYARKKPGIILAGNSLDTHRSID